MVDGARAGSGGVRCELELKVPVRRHEEEEEVGDGHGLGFFPKTGIYRRG